uniref:Uncharacterized protein n=1 Tax=viral metagenome TaxID=1070528 RepID=A0A6C0ADV1_9ZZZZ
MFEIIKKYISLEKYILLEKIEIYKEIYSSKKNRNL